MNASGRILCGVIEGFYGRSWSHALRLDYASYLADADLDACFYAPKDDPFLRKSWQQDWPDAQWRDLQELASAYRQAGVAWGVGLSPFELYRDYGPGQRAALQRKIGRLAELEAPLLAVLFDDMPGDLPDLAQRQADIVADIGHWLPGARLVVCPTYYSFDPLLEQYFGNRPEGYWAALGDALAPSVDVFWTGNAVCSASITAADLSRITGLLGRRVMLWDNYPVNDGADRSRFLYTTPLHERSADILPLLSGHLCNPMNQGRLSLPALTGLARLHGRRGWDEPDLVRVLGEPVWQALKADAPLFETEGLEGIGPSRCAALAEQYAALPGPAAAEIAGWLRGEYAFDPACLTG